MRATIVVSHPLTFSRHHGQIRIDDSPLGGARFVAELPAGPVAGRAG